MFLLNLERIISVCQKEWIESCNRFQTYIRRTNLKLNNAWDFIINANAIFKYFPGHTSSGDGLKANTLFLSFLLKLLVYPTNCLFLSFTQLAMTSNWEWRVAQIMINKTCFSYSKLIPQINCDKIFKWIDWHNLFMFYSNIEYVCVRRV